MALLPTQARSSSSEESCPVLDLLAHFREKAHHDARAEAHALAEAESAKVHRQAQLPNKPASREDLARIRKRDDGRVARFMDRYYKKSLENELLQTRTRIEQLRVFLSVIEGETEIAPDNRDILRILRERASKLSRETYCTIRGNESVPLDGMTLEQRIRHKNKEAAYVSRYKGHHFKDLLEQELDLALEMLNLVQIATDDAHRINCLETELEEWQRKEDKLRRRHCELERGSNALKKREKQGCRGPAANF